MEAAETVAAYEALVNRALQVAAGAPYWTYVQNRDYAQVTVKGRSAVLSWTYAASSYGDYCDETGELQFPLTLLQMPDEEFAKWKAAERAKYDRKQVAEAAAAQRTREAQERAAYEALKVKFG